MDEINKELRDQARQLGLCVDWQRLWRKNWSNEKMVEMMYRGLDFCLKYHWPSNDYILKHFDQDFRRKSNVFVNDKYSVCNPKQSIVLGSSEIIFRYNGFSNGIIHVRDNASVKIIARNKSFVIVHVYENAHINAEQNDKATVVIVKNSPNVTIDADKTVKIREELDYLE